MNEPEFLEVKPGDTVLVGEDENAKVIHFLEEQETHFPPNLSKSQTLIQAKSNLFYGEEVKQILSKRLWRLKIMFEVLFT